MEDQAISNVCTRLRLVNTVRHLMISVVKLI